MHTTLRCHRMFARFIIKPHALGTAKRVGRLDTTATERQGSDSQPEKKGKKKTVRRNSGRAPEGRKCQNDRVVGMPAYVGLAKKQTWSGERCVQSKSCRIPPPSRCQQAVPEFRILHVGILWRMTPGGNVRRGT